MRRHHQVYRQDAIARHPDHIEAINRTVHPIKVKSIILSTGLLLVTILVIEIALMTFTPFPIHAFKANQVDDDILSHRLDQSLGGCIDNNGFRNYSVSEQADTVTIGNSHSVGNSYSSNQRHYCFQQYVDELLLSPLS